MGVGGGGGGAAAEAAKEARPRSAARKRGVEVNSDDDDDSDEGDDRYGERAAPAIDAFQDPVAAGRTEVLPAFDADVSERSRNVELDVDDEGEEEERRAAPRSRAARDIMARSFERSFNGPMGEEKKTRLCKCFRASPPLSSLL